MKRIQLLLTAMLLCTFTYASSPTPCTTCPSPNNVQVSGKSPGSISFDWDDCVDANYFEVWYVRKIDGQTSATYTTSSSDYSFGGLQAGEYDFYFVEVCGSGSSTAIIIHDEVVN